MVGLGGFQQPAPAPGPPQQPSEIELTISGEAGAPPRFAVPDFLPLSEDAELAAIARTIGQVLWDDLEFEREFYADSPRHLRDRAAGPVDRRCALRPLARARAPTASSSARWSGRGGGLTVQVRLYNVKSRQSVFAKEYSGSAVNPRLYAHTIADEIHQQQRGLQGVARSKLTFSSDRDGERPVRWPIAGRSVKEIYISDYDGANQRRVTVNRALNIFPVWSADGRARSPTRRTGGTTARTSSSPTSTRGRSRIR